MQQRKNIFVLGCTGAGKSYLLNILIGSDNNSNQPLFQVGDTNSSCTSESQFQEGSLYGLGKILLNVIDTPGLFDTNDQDRQYKNDDMPTSIQHLVKLSDIIRQRFHNQVNRVLLCIDANRKWDQTAKNIVKIANIFMPSKQKVSVIITKMNTIQKKNRQSMKDSWKKELDSQNLEQVFFFGEDQNDVDPNFENNLQLALPEQMRTWADLSVDEKNVIGECFKYQIILDKPKDCFSLDMLISLTNGQFVSYRDLLKSQLLSHNSSNNKFLGFIHFDKEWLTSFIQFVTEDNQVLECTDNHLVYCASLIDGTIIKQFIKASQLQVGDYLLQSKLDEQGKIINLPIQLKQKLIILKKGFWCPLTTNGMIIVNSFLVSSYCSVSEIITQDVAHIAMKPLIYYRQLFGWNQDKQQQEFYSTYARFGKWMFKEN